MLIARVVDQIVASAKNSAYQGHKILSVIPEGWDGRSLQSSAPIVALDLVDAGVGDRVLVCQEGGWARAAVGDIHAPVRSMVVAIVDQIRLNPAAPALPGPPAPMQPSA
ncbi:MAG: EutN/CcmL family microcompartment protein [candidate division Zixibacteria bacterium]|nr:EutN/CcmL family microcompartment protein [candidate division Zixibacteria bacterium]